MTAGPPNQAAAPEAKQAPARSDIYRDTYKTSASYWDNDYRSPYDSYGKHTESSVAAKHYDPYDYDYGYDRSGYGCYSGGGGQTSFGKDETALTLSILVGGAIVTYILRQAIITNLGTRQFGFGFDLLEQFSLGLEEFEEKIDRIADGQNGGDQNSWISDLYNQFAGQYGDVDNSLKESDLDGLEPPVLDETWGLGLRNQKNGTASTTVQDAVDIEDEDETREKREATNQSDEEKCRVDMWRCLSSVIEGGLHYLDKPEGLMGMAKKTMFKMAFHGTVGNVWSGVMNIPEARRLKKCMTAHQECISYEVLRREAANNLDPNDPDYELYVKINEEKADQLKQGKKERIIVNPEYVQSLDQTDGAEE